MTVPGCSATAAASLVLAAVAGAAASYGLVRLATGDACSDGFPSQGFVRALSVTAIMSALGAVYLALLVRSWINERGRRACAAGAEAMGILGLVVGALAFLPSVGLLLLAQSFPLCVD